VRRVRTVRVVHEVLVRGARGAPGARAHGAKQLRCGVSAVRAPGSTSRRRIDTIRGFAFIYAH
jgi:hypothetical protein